MPAGQATDMLSQLMQQLLGGQMASQSMGQLQDQGLGRVNYKKMFKMPQDQQDLQSSVLQSVLGRYYGGGQGMGLPDTTTMGGGMQTALAPRSGLQGSGQMGGYSPMGPQDIFSSMGGGNPDAIFKGGDPTFMPPGGPQFQGSGSMGGGGFQQQPGFGQFGETFGQQGGGQVSPDAFSGKGYQPFQGGQQSVDGMIQQMWNQQQGQNPAGQQTASSPGGGVQWMPGSGLPGLDPNTQGQINSIYQPKTDQMNMDFEQQKNQMLQDLFGRGMQASTAATDAGGKLLYGRSAAMNQIGGQKAQAELDQRNKLMDMMSKLPAGAFSGGGGGAGGGGGGFVPPNMFGGTQDGALTASIMGQMQGMDRPMNFDQAMQLKQLQLQQSQLQQQGALGFGGLDLQRQLGMGSQGLQGQGLQQDFLTQLLGMGQQRTQSQASMQQSDLARMQQYLLGQQGMATQLGGQQAQIEAQKKSFLSSLMSGILGGGSALLGAASSAGGFGSLFK